MNLIVAVSENWGIGRGNRLIFSIREDLKRFREITMGKVVVMGHNTFKSLPNGRPLAGRVNIVLSRNESLCLPGAVVLGSIDALTEHLRDFRPQDVFIIGGAQVYGRLMDRCSRAYVTKVHAAPPADVFMPDMDTAPGWRLAEQSQTFNADGLEYTYCLYKR
ncbi:MAG: dihydrofolate reductase [Defluviitaleaceae bacterium]|nr:dihydrofolate reductase [Defluviitaleaceae bacterium]